MNVAKSLLRKCKADVILCAKKNPGPDACEHYTYCSATPFVLPDAVMYVWSVTLAEGIHGVLPGLRAWQTALGSRSCMSAVN
jgi:hypothetical protein